MKKPKNKHIIATVKSWNIEAASGFINDNPELNIKLITDKSDLTFNSIKAFNPRYIFFPHWSWIIPKVICENFECVVFHMTDLPFGRGGSPLQNLIERDIYKTKISALRVVEELDGGPIYLKRPLSLKGAAKSIFKRCSKLIFEDMIPYIIHNNPQPVPQKGTPVTFARRKPEQSNIGNLKSTTKVYDYIRMLDAEDYPAAFVETDRLRIEFFNAKLEEDCVSAKTKIKIRKVKGDI